MAEKIRYVATQWRDKPAISGRPITF